MIRSYDGMSPTIAESAFVDDDATIIGDVTIEADASVWPGAVLRGDHGSIVLREGANVQDNATLHEGAEIGRYATVGHNAIVHSASIDARATVGMGAIVLDDSTIGEESIVGANSLVTENTTVSESVLVAGTPVEVIKELSDSSWASAGKRYVEYAKKHAETSEILTREEVSPDIPE